MTYSSHMIYIYDCDRHLNWFYIWFLYWLTLLLSVHIHMLYLSYSSIIYHYVHTVYIHEHFPFFYTLIRSLPDDPGFARPDTGCFMILIRCSIENGHVARNWSFSLSTLVLLSLFWFLLICSFPDHLYFAFSYYSIPYSYIIMCGHLYMLLQWLWFSIVDFYSLFGLL